MREKCYLLKKQNNLLQASVDQYKYVKPQWQEYNIIERQDIIMDVESYYETDGRRHASPHLFLITDSNDGIMLSSYEIPEGEDKNTFSYVSHFTPVMIFCLWEKFSEECLEVSESMEVNGKKTFGYDEPIIYKRV